MRKRAQNIEAVLRVGKEGLESNIVKSLSDALETKELVKLKVLNNSEVTAIEIADKLAKETDSTLIHILGNTIVFYKVSKNNPTISDEIKGI